MDDSRSTVRFPDSENHSFNSIKELTPPETLLVREQFLTVQGEMPFAGYPAYFIRLGGCNRGRKLVSCSGCDTDFRVSQSQAISFDQLLANIESADLLNKFIVITGGEPLLQREQLNEFLEYIEQTSEARYKKYHFQFETNGDVDPIDLLDRSLDRSYVNSRVSFVVSPKEPFSKRDYWFIKKEPFKKATKLIDNNVYIRRIVSADVESAYYLLPKFLSDRTLDAASVDRVYLSGQTIYHDDGSINIEATKTNVAHATDLATRFGFKVSFQSHVFLGIR